MRPVSRSGETAPDLSTNIEQVPTRFSADRYEHLPKPPDIANMTFGIAGADMPHGRA